MNYHDNLIKESVWRCIGETFSKDVEFTCYSFKCDCKLLFYCRTHFEMKFSLLLSASVKDCL